MRPSQINVSRAEWAAVLPFCNRVFKRQEINTCCRENGALQFTPSTAATSLAEILENVGSLSVRKNALYRWKNRSVNELAGYILEHLHRPIGVHLANIDTLIGMIGESHAMDAGIKIRQLESAFSAFRIEMDGHLFLEEDILYPWIGQTEGTPTPEFLSALQNQHALLVEKIKSVFLYAGQVTQLADGCDGCRALFATLKRVETLLRDQIYFENNLLFPQIVALTPRS